MPGVEGGPSMSFAGRVGSGDAKQYNLAAREVSLGQWKKANLEKVLNSNSPSFYNSVEGSRGEIPFCSLSIRL